MLPCSGNRGVDYPEEACAGLTPKVGFAPNKKAEGMLTDSEEVPSPPPCDYRRREWWNPLLVNREDYVPEHNVAKRRKKRRGGKELPLVEGNRAGRSSYSR